MIGENILKYLKIKGISQKQASIDLVWPASRLSQYIKGKREPDIASILKLCEYLNVSADNLLGRINNESNQTNSIQKTESKSPAEQSIDPNVLSEIFEIIEKWEQQSKFKLTTQYRVIFALTAYKDVVCDAQNQRTAKIINLLNFFRRTGDMQRIA